MNVDRREPGIDKLFDMCRPGMKTVPARDEK